MKNFDINILEILLYKPLTILWAIGLDFEFNYHGSIRGSVT